MLLHRHVLLHLEDVLHSFQRRIGLLSENTSQSPPHAFAMISGTNGVVYFSTWSSLVLLLLYKNASAIHKKRQNILFNSVLHPFVRSKTCRLHDQLSHPRMNTLHTCPPFACGFTPRDVFASVDPDISPPCLVGVLPFPRHLYLTPHACKFRIHASPMGYFIMCFKYTSRVFLPLRNPNRKNAGNQSRRFYHVQLLPACRFFYPVRK